ncbi:hypothetical protein CVT26_009781 [Gymnopilus dilepis]|uniref:Uncharacterized protein n=1 Tax=Gymnopilus dilepis TaxID=231916 RepID=A0A409YIV8_9AGAR|nr:hypothetical protein CVT26_009781 [Gymnopilus dilepis]
MTKRLISLLGMYFVGGEIVAGFRDSSTDDFGMRLNGNIQLNEKPPLGWVPMRKTTYSVTLQHEEQYIDWSMVAYHSDNDPNGDQLLKVQNIPVLKNLRPRSHCSWSRRVLRPTIDLQHPRNKPSTKRVLKRKYWLSFEPNPPETGDIPLTPRHCSSSIDGGEATPAPILLPVVAQHPSTFASADPFPVVPAHVALTSIVYTKSYTLEFALAYPKDKE